MATAEGWVDIAEVTAHLQVTKDSIYHWVDTKGFPDRRGGRLLRSRLSEVDEGVKAGGEDSSSLSSSETMGDSAEHENK